MVTRYPPNAPRTTKPKNAMATPTPYWEHSMVKTMDVARRMDDIVNNNWTADGVISVGKNGPKVAASFDLMRQDLLSQDDDGVAGTAIRSMVRAYVIFDRTRLESPEDTDVCLSIQGAEDMYSLYLAYPSSALKIGSKASNDLEAARTVLMQGFNGWTFVGTRAMPCTVTNMAWYEVTQSWGAIEMRLVVPYNTGMMDNPDLRSAVGVEWGIDANVTPTGVDPDKANYPQLTGTDKDSTYGGTQT